MNLKVASLCILGLVVAPLAVDAQTQPVGTASAGKVSARHETASAVGPVQSAHVRTVYIRLGSADADGLLYEPRNPGPKARVALVLSFPGNNNFASRPGPELAERGYRVLMVNYHGADESPEVYAPSISHGVQYMRSLRGVARVVIIGHSGGGHLLTFYQNVAEHGPAACRGPEKVYPCRGDKLNGLARPDGIILLDPAPGALHRMSSIDPAVDDRSGRRNPALDLFIAANGFNPASGRASYDAEFLRRFYAAQAARIEHTVNLALNRLSALQGGTGLFTDDEPFTVVGLSDANLGARPYHADLGLLAHTKQPHTLLRADGSRIESVVSVARPPSGLQVAKAAGTLLGMGVNTSVRSFLSNDAIRVTSGYGFTADDIVGVDWTSSINSTVGNAEGITVPALVMVMACHYLVVHGEIVFDHLRSNDKTLAAVEGAVHEFTPCRPEYGDTVKRTFDYVEDWLSKPGRF